MRTVPSRISFNCVSALLSLLLFSGQAVNSAGTQAAKEATATAAGASAAVATEHPTPFDATIRILDKRQLTPGEMEELEALVKAHPKDPHGAYTLGIYEQRAGFLDLAAEQFEKAWQMDHAYGDPLVLLVVLRMRMGQDAKVADIAQRAVDNLHDTNVLYRLATMMKVGGELAPAQLVYKRIEALAPGKYPRLQVELTYTMLGQLKFRDAEMEAETVLKSSGNNFEALVAKGEAIMAMGRYKDALDTFQKAASIDPRHSEINGLMERLAKREGNMVLALEPALYNLALTVGDAPANEAAKADVKNLLLIVSPEQSKDIVAKAADALKKYNLQAPYHFALGDVYDRMAKPELAIEQYRLGLAANSRFARAHMRIGKDLEIYHGDLYGAKDEYKKAYDLDNADREIKARYGRVLYHIENRNHLRNDLAGRLKDWMMASTYGGKVPQSQADKAN
jgi:tetratricopeptide (TPR) repeat protein